jgi:CDP-diacylglycerol--glycerol-3-phosphate 3-phosphatidyltransferase
MSAPAVPLPLAQLPNALTVARFLLVPVFVVLLAGAEGGHSWPAAAVFAAAAVSDQVDGWLARRWRVQSRFGKYADPLADRLMIDAAVIVLFLAGRLPWPALLLVVARDAVLVVGAKLVEPRGYELSVNALGKLATWVLYAAIAFILATGEGSTWPLAIFWSGVALSLAAASLYGLAVWKAVRR